MLTYHDVMSADFGPLNTAADRWQKMADEIHKVENAYRDSVQKITMGPTWLGESATAAYTNFAATRYEYQAAQTQAKATATLLRNAHQQFTELKKQLENARADAVKAGMKVSEQGNVAYDWDRLTPAEREAARHDPDHARTVRESEESWQEYIKACVRAVDDADKDLKKDLESAVKDGTGNKNDETLGTGFNGDAGKVAAADDKQKQERLELASLAMRDNETLEDWMQRLQRDGVEKITGSKRLADLFAGVQKGTVTAGAFALALGTSAKSGWKLFKYAKDGTNVTAPGTGIAARVNERMMLSSSGFWSKLPPNVVGALTGSEEAAALGGHMKNGRFFIPTAAEANLARVAANGGLANAAKAAGWLRGAGVVGAAAGTAFGVANLATYNGEMIKEDPAKFASDLSGTAFNASLTALAVAPNPVTAGLAVGTGLVYAGCLVWDNHEAIGKGLDKAGDWIGDKASDIGDGIADGAKKLGSALNPFD
ncbi:hypothetical protein [Streptomyces sp. DH12]|uniref:hypothetical protein n=1 Tax=Streptomyces sp. DH12 TaxID=2857010 RepID=UPI001E5B2EF8|nr:hypothetical protein [Streptomyces sp. DH12]